MERQYIGARYVPKFADPIEWQDGVPYEPLTIVTYMGASYTSKKAVPAGVKPTNSGYWAVTGNYNAQVEAYRQEVVKAVEDIEGKSHLITKTSIYNFFKDKKILILGDSNSVEGEDWRGRTWVTDFREILDGIAGNIVNNSTSGRSFTTGGDNSTNMVDIVNALNGGDYDYIITFCGVNDWSKQAEIGSLNTYENYDHTRYADAVKTVIGVLNAKYPKAQQFYVTPLVTSDYSTVTTPLLVYANTIRGAVGSRTKNACAIDGFLAPCYYVNGNKPTIWSMDGLHPNAAYAPILAQFIINTMMCGGTAVANVSHVLNMKPSDKVNAGAGMFCEVFSDGRVRWYVDATLANTDYKGFYSETPPDWATNVYGGAFWWCDASNGESRGLITIDTVDGNPFPTSGYNDVGARYRMDLTIYPASMTPTRY